MMNNIYIVLINLNLVYWLIKLKFLIFFEGKIFILNLNYWKDKIKYYGDKVIMFVVNCFGINW